METVLAILAALPKIISLVQMIFGAARDAQQRGVGYRQAIADALDAAHTAVSKAQEAARQAQADHAAHPTDDGGFDQTFQRKG